MVDFDELQKLIHSGDTEQFIQQSKKSSNATLINRDTDSGDSLLDRAAIHNRSEIVVFLCKYPTLLTSYMIIESAIHYAAQYGSLESLQILINQSKNLEHKNHDQKTAIELAIQSERADCARILLNHGAKLPVDITDLISLITPFDFILYCEPRGTYQLVSEAEKNLLDTTEGLSEVTLHQKSKYIRKPYFLKINAKDENILPILIDKYLYFCNRIDKETREEKHGASKPEIKQSVELSRAKRESLLKVIRVIVAVTNGHNLEQSLLVNDEIAKSPLLRFITDMQKSKERYFGDDLSDNSDSEEDDVYSQLETPNRSIDVKTNGYLKNSQRQNDSFWLKTKMTTPKNVGLKTKITTVSANIKKGANKKTEFTSLEKVVQTLITNLQNRGKIEYDKSQSAEVSEIIEKINSCSPEKLTELFKTSKPIFILGTRGINYMLDRWNANARRYHRKIDELQQPQYSEAVLKMLPYDYYMDLEPDHDFHRKKEEELLLQKEALRLNKFLQLLGNSKPCVSNSFHGKGSYLFNSVGDCLQDHSSNSVDKHLKDLAEKRSKVPNYWGTHLKNSFNPGIAISSRPYHALKYAFALKGYCSRSMLPRYWNDGTIEYSHVGKVYLSLHPLEEILSNDGLNNLSVQDRRARVSISHHISPEKELSFLGFMPGDRIVHQFVAKFPSFKGSYKPIYEVKYGLNKEVYKAFQYLTSITRPDTADRKTVINLLSEWLCAYHEVLLIEIAKEEALRRGGILAYLDHNEKLTLNLETGRVFTGGGLNRDLRNEVHMMRDLRDTLIQHLTEHKIDKISIPEFDLIKTENVLKTLKNLLEDEGFLKKITNKVKLPEEEKRLSSKLYSDKEIKKIKETKAKSVVNSLIQHGLYANTFSTSYKKQITYLADKKHLYTDLEINELLHQELNDSVNIYASQNPLVQGVFEKNCQKLFIDALKLIFQSNQTAVMPIEISQKKLSEEACLNIVGIHWNGLVISKTDDNSFKIELIDPASSPEKNINLTELPLDQTNALGETVSKILNLIQQAAEKSNVTVQVHWLATQQQFDDLDCGAWTVDNLIQRARNLPLRTRTDVIGPQLRQSHDNQYTSRLTSP